MSIETKQNNISNITNILTTTINIDAKFFGLDKGTLLKNNSDEDEVKGFPFLYYLDSKTPIVVKVYPCDIQLDNSLIDIGYMILFNDELLKTNVCPNIPYIYHYIMNLDNKSKCLSNIPFKKIKKSNEIKDYSHVVFCEYYPEQDIDVWDAENELTIDHWKSIIFQVIITLAILQDKYQFMHNDLHPGNILIDNVLPDTYFGYSFKGKKYYVKNLGFIAKLWDFEFANIFNENYAEYKNVIDYIDYNEAYDIHVFLKGLLQIEDFPQDLVHFIESLYPECLLYNEGTKEVNTNNKTIYLKHGLLTDDALAEFKLPTPKELLEHKFFEEYQNATFIHKNQFVYE